jgi:hypothetical protein
MHEPTPNSPPRRRSAGKVAAIVTGVLVGLLAIGFLGAGAAALWGDAQKDRDGYISTDAERFDTGTYALASDDLDVDLGGAEWVTSGDRLGKVRLEAASRDGKPVFVGIARTQDVDAYLADSAHATVTDVSYPDFAAEYQRHDGSERPSTPASQDIWAASAEGSGTQALTWDVEDGNWSVVVMNADGSAGVDTTITAGANVPFLSDVGWGSLGGGVVLIGVAGALLVMGLRGPRSGPPAMSSRPEHVAPSAA